MSIEQRKACRREAYGKGGTDGEIRRIYLSGKREKASETAARMVFSAFGLLSVLAAAAIGFYILICGIPALTQVGWKEILLGTEWNPTVREPEFGIAYMVLASGAGTILAVLAAGPAGVLTAVFLVEISGRKTAEAVRTAVELLAGVPSVIYGLLGAYVLNPAMYRLERKLFADVPEHRFTGGANLLSAALVLAVMILPTVIAVSEAAVRRVAPDIRAASAALGATRLQTVFRVVLPAAAPGIGAGVILGLGRAMGEASAVMMVAGNSVNFPFPFRSVRFLTGAVVSEMGYSQGIHRQMLFTIGLVLLALIMLNHVVLNLVLKRIRNKTESGGKD